MACVQMEALRTCVMLVQTKDVQQVMPVMEAALRLAAVSLEVIKVRLRASCATHSPVKPLPTSLAL